MELFGAVHHAAELVHDERLAALAHPLLAEQSRPPARQADEEGDDAHDRHGDHEHNGADHDVEHALEGGLADAELAAVERQEGEPVEGANRDARRAHVRKPGGESDLDVDGLEGGVDLKQHVGAHGSAGDHHGGDAGRTGQVGDVLDAADDRQPVDGARRHRSDADEPDSPVAEPFVAVQRPSDRARLFVGADHQGG